MRPAACTALLAGFVLLAAGTARAQTPDYEGEFFTDLTHQIPARAKVDMSRKLRIAAEDSQIEPMLVVIDSVASYPSMPQDGQEFADKLAKDWQIGEVTTHEGILALFAVNDHKYFVARTSNVSESVTDAISASFKRGTLDALKAKDVTRAMSLAADAIASELPAASRGSVSGGGTPVHTVTTTTHTHVVNDSPVSYGYHSSSGGGGLAICPLIGFGLLAWLVMSVFQSVFGASRGYGGGYGGYYGGGGGGGFLSGMATGGLLGYLFGNSGSSYGSGWGSGWGSGGSSWGSGGGSYTDTTTTDTWSSGGGGSSGSSGGSSGGGYDSFGGGNFDGGGSGGSW
jgi:uncharacterized protein